MLERLIFKQFHQSIQAWAGQFLIHTYTHWFSTVFWKISFHANIWKITSIHDHGKSCPFQFCPSWYDNEKLVLWVLIKLGLITFSAHWWNIEWCHSILFIYLLTLFILDSQGCFCPLETTLIGSWCQGWCLSLRSYHR